MPADISRETPPVFSGTKFHFEAEWGAVMLTFQEVSGLDVRTPGLKLGDFAADAPTAGEAPDHVVIKRGTFERGDDAPPQLSAADAAEPLTIRMKDDLGNTMMTWTVASARPVTIVGAEAASEGKRVAFETIGFSHGGVKTGAS
ncbi:MAG TPA: phage tail protein [Ramlibacter sp.]|uniref:phage tail protein n=1 Tax=Ramlibacter sp. TaxID=1917967 RepID=UPI002C122C19|nr:phage tail protein [Ramlibacter sp.]HVZ46698.1 phage tail protein [Ramlibacter sp.]